MAYVALDFSHGGVGGLCDFLVHFGPTR
jgi:hypothetical protein